jgi:hypothetical protein
MDGGKIGRFNLLIVLLAKPYIKGFKPILIDFYLGPTTRRGIAAFIAQVFKNLNDREIFVLCLISKCFSFFFFLNKKDKVRKGQKKREYLNLFEKIKRRI